MTSPGSLHQRSVLLQAYDHLRRGWSLLPLLPGMKVPAVEWQPYQHQPPSEEQARAWFARKMPRYQLGVITGPVSKLLVLDFDDLALFDRFAALHPLLLDTYSVATRRGLHLYYHVEPDDMPPSQGAPGLDLQAAGRYVVAPPSVVEGHAYTLMNDYAPRRLGVPEVAAIITFVHSCRPAPPVELPYEPPQRLTMGDAAAYYRALLPAGRNEALFKAALRARDDGRSQAWTLTALVEAHVAAPRPRGHHNQNERSRRREAQATIASAFSRPPRRPNHSVGARRAVPSAASASPGVDHQKNDNSVGAHGRAPSAAPSDYHPNGAGQGDPASAQLPTAVKQRLNELRQTAVIRLIHALRAHGVQPGGSFYYSQALEIAQPYGIGDWSVRRAIHASTPQNRPIFERDSGARPPTPPLHTNCVARPAAIFSAKNAFISGSQYQRKVNHRPPVLYRMPSDSELAERLGVDHIPSGLIDPIPAADLTSARQTRLACHREFVKERPLQPSGRPHALGFLARRVGVSRATIKRYNLALEIPFYPDYEEFPLGWDSLARLDALTPGHGGYFLANEDGERFPPRREIAASHLQCRKRISLFQQRQNLYRYDLLAGPLLDENGRLTRPLPPVPREPIPAYRPLVVPTPRRLPEAESNLTPPPCAPAGEGVAEKSVAPKTLWACPHCLTIRLQSEHPGPCARCGGCEWESLPESVWRDPQQCSKWWSALCRAHKKRKKEPAAATDPYAARRRYYQPLPDERQEALAQRIHAAMPGYSLANARQAAATTDSRLLDLALTTLRQRRNIYNPVGFFVTFVRSEKKYGSWSHPPQPGDTKSTSS